MNPELEYAVAEVQYQEETSNAPGSGHIKLGSILATRGKQLLVIIAMDLVASLESKWGTKLSVKKKISGSLLENCRFYFFA